MKREKKIATTGTARMLKNIGTCGLFVVLVIQLPRIVDLWEDLGFQMQRRDELVAGENLEVADSAIGVELNRAKEELSEIDHAMVDEKQMPSVQGQLIELARATGCRLRKAVIQIGNSDTWEPEREEFLDEEEEYDWESPFTLNSQEVNLSLSGTFGQIQSFFESVSKQSWMMQVKQASYSRSTDNEDELAVEATLSYYMLRHQAKDEEQFVNWSEGSPNTHVH